MPANTEYNMAPTVALDLARIVQSDLAHRVELLTTFMHLRGEKSLTETFGPFIGLANSVADNRAEMSDLVLIDECGVHPDKFKSVNMPTILGAFQGVALASGCEPAGHCCACRFGSIVNQSPIATTDAAYVVFNSEGLMRHAYIEDAGEPTRVCVGHATACKQLDQAPRTS
ncbi:hypothetical protein [Pseudomonas sp. AK106]